MVERERERGMDRQREREMRPCRFDRVALVSRVRPACRGSREQSERWAREEMQRTTRNVRRLNAVLNAPSSAASPTESFVFVMRVATPTQWSISVAAIGSFPP